MMMSESTSYQQLVSNSSGFVDEKNKSQAVGAVQFTNKIQENDEHALSDHSGSLSDETDFQRVNNRQSANVISDGTSMYRPADDAESENTDFQRVGGNDGMTSMSS